jgi:hypothetical protein
MLRRILSGAIGVKFSILSTESAEGAGSTRCGGIDFGTFLIF